MKQGVGPCNSKTPQNWKNFSHPAKLPLCRRPFGLDGGLLIPNDGRLNRNCLKPQREFTGTLIYLVSGAQTTSEIQGFSLSPLAFCLTSSLIRQVSPICSLMTNTGFRLVSSQFKAAAKTELIPLVIAA